jgi:hypothetical protein
MEWRAIVQFLTPKKLPARDITAELEGAYGHGPLSLSAVKKWRKGFVNGSITLKDDPRSGRPPRSDFCESLQALIAEALLFHANAFARSCGSRRQHVCAFCTRISGSGNVIYNWFHIR